ncbi:hypothetical protein QBC41DRAFT_395536 [Cercophora samala]|uniref:Uncharacterized protein n=1 Tax=Cercophora samala TaxID=330535 RepID=A0AA39ZLJ2_9PEZI|nr:hypothetical protein QBC41DRAFT_395536 [Cercophora samala]
MARRRTTLRATALAMLLATASAIPTHEIFARQEDTCGAPNFSECGNANVPSSFCCPAGDRCLVLAGNTTVVCCPNGSTCQKLRPIDCNIELQDADKAPDSVIKTTALGGSLPKCGSECCPYGYSCVNGECVMNTNQNAAPSQSSTPSSRPSTTPTSKPSTTASPSTTLTATAVPQSTGPPIAGIAGGAAAGAVVLLIAGILAFIFIRKRKAGQTASSSKSPLKLSRSTSSFGNIISAPILHDDKPALRTDFGARLPTPQMLNNNANDVRNSVLSYDNNQIVASPPQQQRQGKNPRMSSVAYGGLIGDYSPQQGSQQQGGYGGQDGQRKYVDMPDMPFSDDGNPGYLGGGLGGGGLAPRTPEQREVSGVSINIFADPRNITPDQTPQQRGRGGDDDGRRYTDMTTFTEMLDRADLGGVVRGDGYVSGGSEGGRYERGEGDRYQYGGGNGGGYGGYGGLGR